MNPKGGEGHGARAEMLRLLCSEPQTVSQLARQLQVSPTAVRKSLARLKREGLVGYKRVIRGVGKPAYEFAITREGESLLSRAYLPLLDNLLSALEQRLPAAQVERFIREAGKRLSDPIPDATGSLNQRLAAAATLLNRLGGTASVQRTNGKAAIDCSCCAIGAVVANHPLACKAMEALLTLAVDVRFRERCNRVGRPRCHFVPQ
ncbi:MAG TPA: ArsR family transcriptional regulator [Gemmatimonadaceae bacterium]|jgi:predicted ArsR family transcriptional regulator